MTDDLVVISPPPDLVTELTLLHADLNERLGELAQAVRDLTEVIRLMR